MTTINLQTKHAADEPDRAKKYVAHGEARSYEDKPTREDPLKYLQHYGWTWDSAPEFYTWEEYVDKFHAHFPLGEREQKAEITGVGASLDLTDTSGDTLKVRVNSVSNRVEIAVAAGYGETSTMVYLRDDNLLALRDLLNARVKEA